MPYKDPAQQKAYWKARYAANKEADNARSAQRRATHKPELASYFRDYRKRKPGIVKKAHDKWRQKHPEYAINDRLVNRATRLIQITAWHTAHPTYRADYMRDHPGKEAELKQRRRARKQGLPDTWTTEEQAFMFAAWGYRCAVCGTEPVAPLVLASDHWIPLASSACPGTVASNMLPLCHGKGGCNSRKNRNNAAQWLSWTYGPEEAMLILDAITAYFAEVQRRFPQPSADAAD